MNCWMYLYVSHTNILVAFQSPPDMILVPEGFVSDVSEVTNREVTATRPAFALVHMTTEKHSFQLIGICAFSAVEKR